MQVENSDSCAVAAPRTTRLFFALRQPPRTTSHAVCSHRPVPLNPRILRKHPPSLALSLTLTDTDTHSLTLDATRQTSATRAYAQQAQAQTSSYVPNKNADGTLPLSPSV